MALDDYDGPERRRFSLMERQLTLILEKVEHITSAIPVVNGKPDVDGHRQYHEAKIKAAEAEEAFWVGVRQESIRKGIWFTFLVVAGLVIIGLKIKLAAWLGVPHDGS